MSLQPKAQVVITAIPSQRIVCIEFSIEIPESILAGLPEFINPLKGMTFDICWDSQEYGFKVFYNRAWDCTDISQELKTFLNQHGITDIYAQIEGDFLYRKPLPN